MFSYDEWMQKKFEEGHVARDSVLLLSILLETLSSLKFQAKI